MGDNRNNRGESKTTLYRRYIDMKARCLNPQSCNYKYYGDRGIKIFTEWLGKDGFKNFKEWALKNGFNKSLSIDRIDNNGDYCPENCRWVTQSIQNITEAAKMRNEYILSHHLPNKLNEVML